MPPGLTPAISVAGLRKAYGDHVVLDGIDLDVPPATVFALLGPNGAGKTTTVEILSTLQRPDGGRALVAGREVTVDPVAVRAAIGVTGQFSAVDDLMTGAENLRLMGALRHLGAAETKRRAAALLERFDLVDAANTMTKNYSGGMLRRLDLAMTLMGDPSIIFLDEPTTGLDPRSRRAVWDNVRELVAGGVTVLLTTQYLEEADQLADRVAVLDRGRIVASGTPAELKRLVAGGYIRLRLHTGEDFDTATVTFADAVADRESRTLRVPSDGGLRSLRGVLDRLDAAGLDVEALEVHTPDLDEVFLALTESETRRVRRAEPEVAR